MLLDDLPTPCLLIEQHRLTANLRRMQQKADAQDVALRPHIKTHKSVALARQQRALGARGLTVAKPGEAEVFAAAGFDDLRLAYPVVGADKHARLLRLMDHARISFCVDTPEGARAASDFYAAHGRRAEVLVEVDCGYGRTGVPWGRHESVDFCRFVGDLPGLQLVGILTHAGQAYHGPEHEGETVNQSLYRVSAEERDIMLSIACRMQQAGIAAAVPGVLEISIGSTPSMAQFENRERHGFRITEIRPGNYVFNDAMQVGLTAATWDDCALTVLTTVVSTHRDRAGRTRLFLDAGKKVLTSDTGYGTSGHGVLLYNPRTMEPLPHARLTALSEEHGWVQVAGGATLSVGDRVRVVPNHACVAVHTQEVLYVVDGEAVVETWHVDARAGSR
jgi:D-serine deaminase-like pyridoxal phosphate-dependent protein